MKAKDMTPEDEAIMSAAAAKLKGNDVKTTAEAMDVIGGLPLQHQIGVLKAAIHSLVHVGLALHARINPNIDTMGDDKVEIPLGGELKTIEIAKILNGSAVLAGMDGDAMTNFLMLKLVEERMKKEGIPIPQ